MYCKKCGRRLMAGIVKCPACGEDASARKGVSISLIVGIVGVATAFLLNWLGLAVSVIGVIFGVVEYRKYRDKTGILVSLIGGDAPFCSW